MPAPAYEVGDLRVDVARRIVWVGREKRHLPQQEFDILAAMARRPGIVFSHDDLLDAIETDALCLDSVIRGRIFNIRKVIKPVAVLRTVHAVGYVLEPPVSQNQSARAA